MGRAGPCVFRTTGTPRALGDVVTLIHMASLWEGGGLMALARGDEAKGLLDSLPDPMKPGLIDLGVVVALVIITMLLLRAFLFGPLMATLAQREHDINAGSDTKAKAAVLIESRQADYASKLKELRAQAFAHRKALADAASKEKQSLVDEARAQAGKRRTEAALTLGAQREAAKAELVAQVDALSESMVQHLLQRA